jgi:hypothetical protein
MMASRDPQDNLPNRSSDGNPSVQPRRVMFDVSELPVGAYLNSVAPTPESDEFIENWDSINRQLFPEVDPPAHQPEPEVNDITAGSSQNDTIASPGRMEVVQALASLLNTSNIEQEEQVQDEYADTVLQATLNERKRRARNSVAKKYFHASHEVYLKLDNQFPSPSSTPDLLGQVWSCPTRKNNNEYTIKWIKPVGSTTWPTNLSRHLRTTFPKDMLHKALPKLIASCAENGFERLRESNILQRNSQNEIQAVPPQQRTQRSNNVGIPGEITTPAPTQHAAFAALHTAGSVSGLSSFGNSETTSRSDRRRRTSARLRNQIEEENDSDDGDTDNEDNYEVDFTQNFWQSRRELQSLIEGEYCDDLDEDDNSVMVRNQESVLDYGRHLEKCSDFNFVELTREEADRMEPPGKVYSGESGLRRGVAGRFSTPLGAFRASGFTMHLVLRWTLSSNKYVFLFCNLCSY